MRFIILTIFILLLISGAGAAGQSGTIKGRVSDKNSGEPLTGVYIVYGKNLVTITTQDGSYLFNASAGKLQITFNCIGYLSVTKEILLNEGATEELNIKLETKVQEIEQIVISANKNEQKIAELSVSMDIIKASYISDNHINNAEELINKTPGIEVMDGQASIRGGSGFSYGAGSRVLALIDGLPVMAADAGNIKWQFLPLENLSQVEIIKGASSVLYGSSALNGVINFRTADASNTPLTTFFAETGIYGKPANKSRIWWDTPRVFANASFSHLQKIGNTDLGIALNLLDDEGYRRLNGEKLGRLGLKLKHFSTKINGLSYGLNINSGLTVKRDFVLWENAGEGALRQQEDAALELHGGFLSIDPYITLKKSNRYRHELKMKFQSTSNRFPGSGKNNSNPNSLYSEYQFWYKISEIFDITAGASGNFDRVNSNFYGDHKRLNLAGYSQLEVHPFKRLNAVAGIRIEQNSLDGINDKLVPVMRAGLNWQAAEYTFLRASFGQGYRYPSIAEKYASTTLGSITIFPNKDILPESGWSAEAGVKQGIRIGKMTGQGDISVFISENSDMIEYYLAIYTNPETGVTSTGFKATNIEQSRVYGSELEISLNRQTGNINTSLIGGYTYIYPVEFNKNTGNDTDIYLKYRRKHSAKMGFAVTWKRVESGLTFYARSKVLRIDDFFLNETTGEAILPGFPGYWSTHNTGYLTLDGNLGYKLNKTLTLSFVVKNITNTEYLDRPGDIQPQRNFSLRLSGSF
jgi:iron complex outermembrane receptor protein